MNFKKIIYSKLNSRQKENYNYQKVSSVLADYGFQTIKLSDDWKGADFLAQHTDGKTSLKIQLKSRLTLDKKYLNFHPLHNCATTTISAKDLILFIESFGYLPKIVTI